MLATGHTELESNRKREAYRNNLFSVTRFPDGRMATVGRDRPESGVPESGLTFLACLTCYIILHCRPRTV